MNPTSYNLALKTGFQLKMFICIAFSSDEENNTISILLRAKCFIHIKHTAWARLYNIINIETDYCIRTPGYHLQLSHFEVPFMFLTFQIPFNATIAICQLYTN